MKLLSDYLSMWSEYTNYRWTNR